MITALIISQVLLWIIVGILAFAGLALARQVGVLFERVAPVGALTPSHGPAVGAPAPKLTLAALDGRRIVFGGPLAPGANRLVLFVSSKCPVCKKLIPIAKRFARAERLEIIFAGDADEAEQRALIVAQDIAEFPFVNSMELGLAYGVDKLPHAVLLDDRGVILSRGLVNSREHLESLLEARDLGLASVQEYLSSTVGVGSTRLN